MVLIYTKIRDQNLNHFIDPTGGMWGKCNESVLFHHTSSQEPESEIVDSFSIGVCYSGLDLGRNRGIDLLPLHGYMGAT